MRTSKSIILAFGLLPFVLVACGDSSSTSPAAETTTAGEEEIATPTISITAPADGDSVTAVQELGSVDLSYEVVDGRDDDAVDCLLNDNSVSLGSDGSCRFKDLPLGSHTLGVAVIQGNGTAYDNEEAVASIEIEVIGVACEANSDCEDNDPCTLTVCESGTCAYYAAPVTIDECESGLDNFICKEDGDCSGFIEGKGNCSSAVCDPDQKVCVISTIADGDTCDDGDTCTVDDSCVEGNCVGGGAADCDDGDVCTTEECVAGEGCVYTDEVCNDDDECTIDSCDPEAGCVFEPSPEACDDGDVCTENDLCAEGVCAGTPKNCADADFCTVEVCNAESGECETDEAASFTCDDDNGCTVDTCTEEGGCEFTPDNSAGCDDENACTVGDICQDGECAPGVSTSCDDADACTIDGNCDPATGLCPDSVAITCDDGNPCTDDFCDDNGSCQATVIPNCCQEDADCDDDNPCTGIETCAEGFCALGTPLVCGDGVTSEECGEQCDDGNEDGNDGCSAVCAIEETECGTDQDCNDGNLCTDDVCSSENGLGGECVYTANTLPCDDGDACTAEGVCVDGKCDATALSCNDGIDCTLDSCDSEAGCVHAEENTLCDSDECNIGICSGVDGCSQVADVDGGDCDGDECTQNGVCQTGTCIGDAVSCDDGNTCTGEDCNPIIGCTFAPIGNKICADGDECTEFDQCVEGTCKGTPIAGCGAAGVICSLSGGAGQEVSCFFKIARSVKGCDTDEDGACLNASQTPEPHASGLQFNMKYDAAKITLDNFYDEIIISGIPFELKLTGPGSQNMGSGHTISPAEPVENWNGYGFVAFVNLSNAAAAFSDAYMEGDAVQGDPEFMEARFTLNSNVNAGDPAEITLEDLEAFTSDGEDMNTTYSGGIIVTSPQ